MSTKVPSTAATAPTPRSVLDSLRDVLVMVARDREYMPPNQLLHPDELHARAIGLAKALLARYAQEIKGKGAAEGQVLRLFEYALLTGFDEAYQLLRGTPPTGVPDLAKMFDEEVPTPAVPDQVAFLMRKMPMAVLLMNAFVDWMKAKETEAATVKVQLPDMLIYSSYWTYYVGVSRAYRILGKWLPPSLPGVKITTE